MKLYHGSKSGLKGVPQPLSRVTCDFGKGFYLGDMETQPKSLIASGTKFPDARFYTGNFDLEGMRVLDFGDNDLDWAMFIAFNRKIINFDDYSVLVRKFQGYNIEYDVIVGVIADDSMTNVLSDFYLGNITDRVLTECLKYVDLGKQYVLKTEYACSRLVLDEGKVLSDKERRLYRIEHTDRYMKMNSIVEDSKKKFRRQGNYFDELLERYKG